MAINIFHQAAPEEQAETPRLLAEHEAELAEIKAAIAERKRKIEAAAVEAAKRRKERIFTWLSFGAVFLFVVWGVI